MQNDSEKKWWIVVSNANRPTQGPLTLTMFNKFDVSEWVCVMRTQKEMMSRQHATKAKLCTSDQRREEIRIGREMTQDERQGARSFAGLQGECHRLLHQHLGIRPRLTKLCQTSQNSATLPLDCTHNISSLSTTLPNRILDHPQQSLCSQSMNHDNPTTGLKPTAATTIPHTLCTTSYQHIRQGWTQGDKNRQR